MYKNEEFSKVYPLSRGLGNLLTPIFGITLINELISKLSILGILINLSGLILLVAIGLGAIVFILPDSPDNNQEIIEKSIADGDALPGRVSIEENVKPPENKPEEIEEKVDEVEEKVVQNLINLPLSEHLLLSPVFFPVSGHGEARTRRASI